MGRGLGNTPGTEPLPANPAGLLLLGSAVPGQGIGVRGGPSFLRSSRLQPRGLIQHGQGHLAGSATGLHLQLPSAASSCPSCAEQALGPHAERSGCRQQGGWERPAGTGEDSGAHGTPCADGWDLPRQGWGHSWESGAACRACPGKGRQWLVEARSSPVRWALAIHEHHGTA